MRKINLVLVVNTLIAAVASLIFIFTLLANHIIGLCSNRSFLSYDGEMFCLIVTVVGLICMTVCLTAVDVVGGSVEESTDDELPTEAVASDHGDDLATVMEAIRNEPLEYRALFDVNKRKLTEGTLNSPERCNVPVEEWKRVYNDIYIDLHNHPGFLQGSFSDNDYRAMIVARARYMIVVTKSFNYIMENPRYDHRSGPTAEEVGKYAQRLLERHMFALLFFTRRYSQYVSRRVAKKFGFIYHVEDLRPQRTEWRSHITPRRIIATSLLTGVIVVTSLMAGSTLATGVSESTSDTVVCGLDVNENTDREYYYALRTAEKYVKAAEAEANGGPVDMVVMESDGRGGYRVSSVADEPANSGRVSP